MRSELRLDSIGLHLCSTSVVPSLVLTVVEAVEGGGCGALLTEASVANILRPAASMKIR